MFGCYYVLTAGIKSWRSGAEYGIDPKTYTRLLFAAGRMSLDNFRRFLDLHLPKNAAAFCAALQPHPV